MIMSFCLSVCLHVESSLYFWNEAYFVLMDNFFYMFLRFDLQMLENFSIFINKGNWSVIFFSCLLFIWFVYQCNYCLAIRLLGNVPSLFVCGIIWILLILILPWRYDPSGLDNILGGRCLITFWPLFKLLIWSWFILDRSSISKKNPFFMFSCVVYKFLKARL